MKFLVLGLLLLSACGGEADGKSGVVRVAVPSPRQFDSTTATLKPRPTPTPSPTPQITPEPTPGLPPPSGALIQAASGMQQGIASSYCWTSPGHSGCHAQGAPSQSSVLIVAKGEVVLLKIDAGRSPNAESIRPFQGGSREGYPSQKIDPALETSLTVDLAPGRWQLDLCATWAGHGNPCWLFEIFIPES